MATVIQAATNTLGNNATDALPGVSTGVPIKILLRTTSSGMYVGGSGIVGVSTGYELNANQEYEFILYPSPELLAASADYALNIMNLSGSSQTYSYVVTLLA